ncbi:autoinhibited Ca(2+)-ATPase 9 [Hibiscus trionum]|uniref:Autoinhibited Ca(2+)-ATPase 9 n=1 Tax=Hibiscus trionum TaxID=183268 RepID=A0A9W7GV03_HIBTR|nr:autoinhibited Ca(2+)-ATPase 9 [Hibiscus trionum]
MSFQASYQVILLLVLNFEGLTIIRLKDDHDSEHAYKVKNTLIFNAFVMCQLFNEFNVRNPEEISCFKGVTKNYLFMGVIGFTLILQVIIIEFLGKFTSTVRLDWQLWLVSIGIGIVSWPLANVGKLILVPETPVTSYFTKPFRRNKASRNS